LGVVGLWVWGRGEKGGGTSKVSLDILRLPPLDVFKDCSLSG